MNSTFILRGHICHAPEKGRIEIRENAYAVCVDGICRGVYDEIPERFLGAEVIDCTGQLILPGMTDLHIHAPQYAYRGTGMDHELLDWLEQEAFPEEAQYADAAYAAEAYGIFARKMKQSATTRALIFGTVHTEATLKLADLMEESGLITYVGKVSMDRDAPPALTENGTQDAAAAAERFIESFAARGYRRTQSIITPRFTPSCSDGLMEALGRLREKYGLPVQSHLSENPDEVELVRKLVPDADCYGGTYDRYGLFGGGGNTAMAHCVYSVPEEVRLMRERGVWAVLCPSSNMNLKSGIPPARRYLDGGLRMGLGTDVAGGTGESMFRAVTDVIQTSKLRWRCVDSSDRPVTFPEAFWLATKGGGSFFGKAGSFEEGYAFDAVVLDDVSEPTPRSLTTAERLERAFYLELDRTGIRMKFAGGERIL